MSESLQAWARRLPRELERAPKTAMGRLRALLAEQAERARRMAPRDTGAMGRSVVTETRGDLGAGSLSLGSTHPGAALQDAGGVVRGRPWLAIPIGPQRYSSPRLESGLFALRSRDGRVFLASRRGGALDLRWRLVRSIVVRGTHWISDPARAIAHQAPDVVAEALRDELEVP